MRTTVCRTISSVALSMMLAATAVVAGPASPASADVLPTLSWHDTTPPMAFGDGYAATTAVVAPRQAVQMPDGAVVFYDASTHNLRRVEAGTQIITTFAGTGVSQSCVNLDGALASTTAVPDSYALASDAAGDLFLAQTQSVQPWYCYAAPILRLDHVDKRWHLVVRNLVNTVGGGVLGKYDHMAVAADGTVFLTDPEHHVVRAFAPGTDPDAPGVIVAGTDGAHGKTGDGGLATAATIEDPYLATAAGVLELADGASSPKTIVRRVDLATGVITHVAGLGVPPTGYAGPDPFVGYPATGAVLGIDAIALSPDGVTTYLHQNRSPGSDIESFTVGGAISSVSASSATGGCVASSSLAVAIIASTPVVLATCHATLRAWPADASAPTSHGTVVAGLDDLDSDGYSPDGVVLADLFPGPVEDIAASTTGAVALAGAGGVRRVPSLTSNASVSLVAKGHGVAVTFGSDGTLYTAILDGVTSHIIATTVAGASTTIAGGGMAPLQDGPSAISVVLPVTDDIAVDSSLGVLYLLACSGDPDPTYTDRPYRQVWAVTLATGAIHRFAGNGHDGVLAEGQTADSVPLGLAGSIAVDPSNHDLVVSTPTGVGRIAQDGTVHGPVSLDHLPGMTVGPDGTIYGQTTAVAPDGTSTHWSDNAPATRYTARQDGTLIALRPGMGSLFQTSDALTPAGIADVPPATITATPGPGSLTISVTPPAVVGHPVNVQLQDLAAPQYGFYVFGFATDGTTAPHTVTLYRAGPPGDNSSGALDPTHTYRAYVSTGDGAGSSTVRVTLASPLKDTTAPLAATNVTATQTKYTDPQVHLTLPAGPDLGSVQACMTAGTTPAATVQDCPMGPDVVTVAYPLTSATITVALFRGVVNDPSIARTFTVFVTDVAGNVSPGASVTIPPGTLSSTDPGPVPDINWQSSTSGRDATFSFRADPDSAAIIEGNAPPAAPALGGGVDSGRTWLAAGLVPGHTYTVAFFRWNDALTHVTRSSATFVAGTSSHDSASLSTPTAVNYGAKITVSTTVTRAVTGTTATTPAAGVPVELWTRTAPSTTWVRAATATTGGTGTASWARPALAATTSYQVRIPAQGYLFPTVVSSRTATTVVRSMTTASLSSTTTLVTRTMRAKTKAPIYVHVSPRQVRTIAVQRYTSGVWRTILTTRTNSLGYAAYTFTPTTRGNYSLRVVCAATATTASSVSRTLVVKAT